MPLGGALQFFVLWPALFLGPSLCPTASELKAGMVTCFAWSDTPALWTKHWVRHSLWSSWLAFMVLEPLPCDPAGVRVNWFSVLLCCLIWGRAYTLWFKAEWKKGVSKFSVALSWNLASAVQSWEGGWEMLVIFPF